MDDDILYDIKSFIEENNCKCTVKINVSEYFIYKDTKNLLITFGKYGFTTVYLPKDNEIIVNFEFKIKNNLLDAIADAKLSLTRNSDDNVIRPIHITRDIDITTEKFGVYKKNNFDRKFLIMKKVRPKLTEKEFAIYDFRKNKKKFSNLYRRDNIVYNKKLVDVRPYDGDNNIIDIILHKVGVPTNMQIINLSLLKVDIRENIDHIKNLLLLSKR